MFDKENYKNVNMFFYLIEYFAKNKNKVLNYS